MPATFCGAEGKKTRQQAVGCCGRVISCVLTLTVGPELKQLCAVDAGGRLANESSWSQDSSSTFQRSRRGQIATLASEPRLEANPQKGLYHAPNENVPISL